MNFARIFNCLFFKRRVVFLCTVWYVLDDWNFAFQHFYFSQQLFKKQRQRTIEIQKSQFEWLCWTIFESSRQKLNIEGFKSEPSSLSSLETLFKFLRCFPSLSENHSSCYPFFIAIFGKQLFQKLPFVFVKLIFIFFSETMLSVLVAIFRIDVFNSVVYEKLVWSYKYFAGRKFNCVC